jgi:deoxyribonuclease-4
MIAPPLPKVGVHLSLGAAPIESLAEAHEEGAACIQIFASSPGAWKPPALSERKIQDLQHARSNLAIDPIVIHAIYLINLASSDPVLVHRSLSSLIHTLHAGAACGAGAVVTHLGSHGGRGFEEVAGAVANGLLEVAESTPDTIELLLENSAGAGGLLGSEMWELADLLDRCGGHARIGVALDTAHLCGSGWDFTQDGAAHRLLKEIEGRIGLDRVKVIHANDSKVPPGSRRDRHACIGEGFIGIVGFESLLAQPGLRRIPWILETPDLDTKLPKEERFRSLRTIRSLIQR